MSCTIDDCGRESIARGWCGKHYQRWARHGDPNIILTTHGMGIDDRFWSHVERLDSGCWVWTAARNTGGYGMFKVDRTTVAAHRFVMRNALEDAGDECDWIVCHTCDNPPCVNPSHLFIGTFQDNLNDMIAKGRQHFPGTGAPLRGEAHPKTTLTTEQVHDIRARFTNGEKRSELSTRFGVGWSTIDRIAKRETWAHI